MKWFRRSFALLSLGVAPSLAYAQQFVPINRPATSPSISIGRPLSLTPATDPSQLSVVPGAAPSSYAGYGQGGTAVGREGGVVRAAGASLDDSVQKLPIASFLDHPSTPARLPTPVVANPELTPASAAGVAKGAGVTNALHLGGTKAGDVLPVSVTSELATRTLRSGPESIIEVAPAKTTSTLLGANPWTGQGGTQPVVPASAQPTTTGFRLLGRPTPNTSPSTSVTPSAFVRDGDIYVVDHSMADGGQIVSTSDCTSGSCSTGLCGGTLGGATACGKTGIRIASRHRLPEPSEATCGKRVTVEEPNSRSREIRRVADRSTATLGGKPMSVRWIIALGVAAVVAPVSSAQLPSYLYPQQYGPYQRPVVSPYLNILTNPNPAVGYYLGKVSEADRRNFQANAPALFGASLAPTAMPLLPPTDPSIPQLDQTGHTATFLNFGTFYQFNVPQRTFNPLPIQGGGVPFRR